MVAPAILAAGVDRPCHLHVSASGSDANAGTKAAPFKTISKAVAEAAEGKRVGLRRGDAFRPEEVLSLAKNKLAIGPFGPGRRRWTVTGGKIVTGWEASGGSEPTSNEALNSGLEEFAAAKFNGWTIELAPVTQSTEHHSGSFSAQVRKAEEAGKLLQKFTPASNALYAFTGWHLESVAGKKPGLQIKCVAAGTTYFLSAAGTWSTAAGTISPGASGGVWSKYAIGFKTLASTTQLTVQVQSFDGGAYNCFWDDCTFGPAAAGSTYSAPLATTTTAVTVTTGTTVTFLASGQKAASVEAMTPGTWFQTGGRLYLYLAGGADPSTKAVEAAVCTPFESNGHPGLKVEGGEFLLGINRGLTGRSTASYRDVAFRYQGYSSEPGALQIAGAPGTRVLGFHCDQTDDDGIWVGYTNLTASTGVEIGWFRITNVNGPTSDGIQYADDHSPCSGAYVHDGYVNMVGTDSPKNCILIGSNETAGAAAGTGSRVERVECLGGLGGVSIGHSQFLLADSVLRLQATATYGGNIYIAVTHDLEEVEILRVLAADGYRSLSGPGGYGGTRKRAKMAIRHCTFANGSIHAINMSAEDAVSGVVKDSIIWAPATTGPIIKIAKLVEGETLDFQNCIIGPERTSGEETLIEWLGVKYKTLQAWQEATGLGAGCKSSIVGGSADPKFVNPGTGNYSLGSGSPALAAASDGGNLGYV